MLAEGAKFFMISPGFDEGQLSSLAEDQLKFIQNFVFYNLVDKNDLKYQKLARTLRFCSQRKFKRYLTFKDSLYFHR